MMRKLALTIFLLLTIGATAWAEERFPPPDFRSGYKLPETQFAFPRAVLWSYLDVAALFTALSLAAYFALFRRSRTGIFWLTAASVAYFGFYRQGCVCSVGSLQNVALALFDHSYGLPWVVGLYFALPLAFALFFGRVFCAGVCPLGTLQDLVLFKPREVPAWLETGLGLFAHVYLGLAVLFAATGSDFLICAWDPFVSFYRLTGSVTMLLLGVVVLVTSMFIGRVYCRFICPYGVLLRLVSPLARWKIHVSPKECIDCKLCENACPFGALTRPTRATRATPRENVPRRLALLLLLLPLSLAAMGLLGYATRGTLARMDRTVRLAESVALLEKGTLHAPSDEILAWRRTGESTADLSLRAGRIQQRFGVGGALLGLWIALAIGLRLVRVALPRQRTAYDADPAGCLACARCFRSCPVELERRGLVAPREVPA